MGFGEGDETTVLISGYITYYFRKIVNIPDISLLENVYFNMVHDDGAVAYVNGNEVLRSALMPSGTINYLTGTTTFIPNDVENDFWYYPVDKSYFQNGENIIAVEIHNQQVSSSDISFDCYGSDTLIVGYKLDGPYVFYRDGEVVVKTVESSGKKSSSDNKLQYLQRKEQDKVRRSLKNKIEKCEDKIEKLEAEISGLNKILSEPNKHEKSKMETTIKMFDKINSDLERELELWEKQSSEMEEFEKSIQ
jgi:hypothetical protein